MGLGWLLSWLIFILSFSHTSEDILVGIMLGCLEVVTTSFFHISSLMDHWYVFYKVIWSSFIKVESISQKRLYILFIYGHLFIYTTVKLIYIITIHIIVSNIINN